MQKAIVGSKLFFVLLVILAWPMNLTAADEAESPLNAQKREYLKSILYTRDAVRDWLAGKVVWGEPYHPVLGWVHNDRTIKHGVEDSYASYRYDPDGARHVMAYAGQPCRINTYGNSFTSCEQVNDGETWQEYLAVHLQEPVRNFGIGGYSVYQAYRRMLLEEEKTQARFIIFNIFDDDHYRNLVGWRNIRQGITPARRKDVSSPPLPYVTVNPATGEFVEHDNPGAAQESIYNFCDIDWVFEHFKDDFQLRLKIAERNIQNGTPEKSYEEIRALAADHGVKMEINSGESLRKAVDTILNNAGFYASMRIVEKIEAYAAQHGKKVLYILSYGSQNFRKTATDGKRFDQAFVDFMKKKKLPFVDLLQAHFDDYMQSKLDVESYIKQYWIGHYNPRGNFFGAFAMKDELVEMLDPKPRSYNPQAR